MTASSAIRRPLRRMLIATTLGVLALPLASHAGGLDQAMDTCLQAFVSKNLPKEQPVVIEKRSSRNQALDSRGTYRIAMTATGSTSGRQFAKAICVVGRKGNIIALNGERLLPPADRVAAR